jgi:CRP/FNR family transcriptional regulator
MTSPGVPSRLTSRCGSCPSRADGICCGLTSDELRLVSGMMRHRHFVAGDQIIHQDDVSELFAVVVSGTIKLTRTLSDGREQIVALLAEADCLGDLFARENHETAQCVTDVVLCCFPRDRFKALLADHPDLERRLLTLATKDLDDARDWLLTIGRKNATEKVATFLVWLLTKQHRAQPQCMQTPSDLVIELPLSRQEMGDLLGLTMETVSRHMTKLRQADVIKLDAQGHRVFVEDLDMLERLAHLKR